VLQGQHSFISCRAQKRDLPVRPIRGWREFGIQQVWQKELLKEAVASLGAPPASPAVSRRSSSARSLRVAGRRRPE
jgi:hypothetical protein